MIDVSMQQFLWALAGILLLAFLAVRGQRGLHDLLIDRDSSGDLFRK